MPPSAERVSPFVGAQRGRGPEEGVVEGVVGVDGRKVAQADLEGLAREPQADLVCHPLLAGGPLEEGVARVPAPEGKLDPEAGGKRVG